MPNNQPLDGNNRQVDFYSADEDSRDRFAAHSRSFQCLEQEIYTTRSAGQWKQQWLERQSTHQGGGL